MKRISIKRYLLYGFLILGGILIGWLISLPGKHSTATESTDTVNNQQEVWTCSMHPQIRKPEPGKCPLCAMDLIPLEASSASYDPRAIHLSREAVALANVETSVVSGEQAMMEVRLYGKVSADERLLQSQVSYVSGRIEKLYVNFTGEAVRAGQRLALIYSPDLINAQQELLEAGRFKQSQPAIYEAVREKLKQWKLSSDQIDEIEKGGKVQTNVEIRATTGGIITSKRVNTGDFINPGTVLYDVADLSTVWIQFDAYESDLPFINRGDQIKFTAQALPGTDFSGKISFIDPVIDPVTRVAKVRVEMPNRGAKLKPEMFVTGILSAIPGGFMDKLTIPRTAVLWTGKRSIVYVQQAGTDDAVFLLREVELGPVVGSRYIVISGLNEGEKIVTRGVFNVDAAAQLEGKASMMNPVSGGANNMEGNHNENQSGKSASEAGLNEGKAGAEVKTQTNTFEVAGLCEMCKDRIETAAKSVKGVSFADWTMSTRQLKVVFDPGKTSLDAIRKAVAAAGHDNGKYKADDKTYSTLPECCRYRN